MSFRLLVFLEGRQIVTDVLDASLCGTLIVIVFEERPPHRHRARSVRRNAGSKAKNSGDICVWKLAAVTLGQCREIRCGYLKPHPHRAVAFGVGSVTSGTILLI